jgi:hypothetical protein
MIDLDDATLVNGSSERSIIKGIPPSKEDDEKDASKIQQTNGRTLTS